MPKDKVTHFYFNSIEVSCGKPTPDVEWTKDPDDVTCNNCRRTYYWKRAAA